MLDNDFGGCIASIALVVFLCIGTFLFGKDAGRESFEKEAIEHGAATWTVDADGERQFVWNESEADGE